MTRHYSQRWTTRYYQLIDLIDEHKPETIIEVGTHHGDRACGMIEAALDHHPSGVSYTGYDLFDLNSEDVHRRERWTRPRVKLNDVQNRLEDMRKQFAGAFEFSLIAGDTRDTLPIRAVDFAFIDGGHSIETIQSDYDRLKQSQVVVLDDYYSRDHTGACADVTKTGCNSLVRSLKNTTVLPIANLIAGGGEVRMVSVIRK